MYVKGFVNVCTRAHTHTEAFYMSYKAMEIEEYGEVWEERDAK